MSGQEGLGSVPSEMSMASGFRLRMEGDGFNVVSYLRLFLMMRGYELCRYNLDYKSQ